MSLDEIESGVFLGGQREASNFNLLKLHGITHIINCAKHLRNSFPDDFSYLNLPILDDPTDSIDDHIDSCNSYLQHRFISTALSSSGKVFLHCHQGMSRSASLVIAYLMWRHRLHFSEAFDLTQRKRPVVNPNLGFIAQLKLYQRRLVMVYTVP